MIHRTRIVGIVASVAMAVIGTALLLSYVRGADARAAGGQGSVRVLVLSETVPKGTKAEELAGRARLEQVPAHLATAGALTDISSLSGQVALFELGRGEQVVPSRFGPQVAGASPGVPPGMLEVTVPVEIVRAVGGQLRAGDSVGVVASFDDPGTSRMILQKVRVTNVRAEDGSDVGTDGQGTAATTRILHVTLALDAGGVERVVFAAEYGRLWLSTQPENAPTTPTGTQSKATVIP